MRNLVYLLIIFTLQTTLVFSQNTCAKKAKVYDSCVDDSDLFKINDCATFVNAEFLYWTASAGDNEYCLRMNTPAPAAATVYGYGDYKFASYDYDPGFRISLGWFNAPKYWQFLGQFTWIEIKGSDRENKPSQSDLYLNGSFSHSFLTTPLQSAISKIKFNHELGDFLVARVYNPNEHLRIRLYGGFTGGRLRQTWNVKYTDALTQEAKVFNKWKFLGIGFRVASDFDWFWRRDFYLTAKASMASLVGKYTNTQTIHSSITSQNMNDVKYSQYRGSYNVDFLLGPSYQRSFECNRIEVFAGYELNSWFNVHEIIRTSGSSSAYDQRIASINNGIFLLHGLTARLTVDF